MKETSETKLIDIGYGITARCEETSLLPLSEDFETCEETWTILYNGKELATCGWFAENPTAAELLFRFEPHLTEILGEDVFEYIRRQHSANDLERPPWDRVNTPSRPLQIARHTLDDEGNASRFEDECRDWLVFDRTSKEWYSWKLNHWESTNEDAGNAARYVARSIAKEKGKWETAIITQPLDGKVLSEFNAHVKRSANLPALKAMRIIAQTNMTIDMAAGTDKTLLACKNGIVDCKTGEFYPLWECDQFRERYPTVYVNCTYTPKQKSQKWIKHLRTVMQDNTTEELTAEEISQRKDNLAAYLLRLFGYILYPGNPERVFVFFWGKGRNGKSTTTAVLQSILGNQSANPTLSQLYASDTDRPAPSVAAALPLRLAIFSEADGDAPVSASAFKELTGEAFSSRWRMMHANNVSLPINCLPIGTTNEIPQFDKPVDNATLNRLITIPFRHVFAEEKRDVTGDLLTQKDAIFSMMVDELRNYLAEGLLEPHGCARATQKELLVGEDMYNYFTRYLEPSDVIWEQMTRQELKAHFLAWAEEMGAEIDTRTYKDESGATQRQLTKKQVLKLFNAARIMGYQEVKVRGTRKFTCRRAPTSKQEKLL